MKKNTKHVVIGSLAGLMVGTALTVSAGTWVNAYRNDEIKVTLNGVEQTFRDATTGEVELPLTYNDRTYLPLRSLANLVGVGVDYDSNTKTAILTSKDASSTVSKINDSKDWVYDAEYPKAVFVDSYKDDWVNVGRVHYASEIKVPYVNVDSPYATLLNSKLKHS